MRAYKRKRERRAVCVCVSNTVCEGLTGLVCVFLSCHSVRGIILFGVLRIPESQAPRRGQFVYFDSARYAIIKRVLYRTYKLTLEFKLCLLLYYNNLDNSISRG